MTKISGAAAVLLVLAACGQREATPVPLANEAAALDRQIEARGNQLAAEADTEAEANAASAIAGAEAERANSTEATPANQL